MVTKSRLKAALFAEKGVDFKKLKQKKLAKKARNEKSKKSVGEWKDVEGDNEDEEAGGVKLEDEEEDDGSGEDRHAQVCPCNRKNLGAVFD